MKPSANNIAIDTPYDRKVMMDLIDLSPPGLDEIMALKTMMDLIETKENSISGVVYNIRMEKYEKRLGEIKENLPVLQKKS